MGEGVYILRSRNRMKESEAEFNRKLASGSYVRQLSYLSPRGGYVLYQSGHNYHKEEVDAARILANHGYRVELHPEGMYLWASAWHGDTPRYSEGTIEGVLYDQKTVDQSASNIIGNVKNALNHAKEKNAKIALIYDPNGKVNRHDLRKGIKKFMDIPKNRGRLDGVFMVTSKGSLFVHRLK